MRTQIAKFAQTNTRTKSVFRLGEAMTRMVCVKCGWFIDDNIQVTFCPDCKNPLKILKGDKEHLDKRTDEIKAAITLD
jgi:Zn finger protein HypA/HybF involved in hydrogenase expression